MQEMSR